MPFYAYKDKHFSYTILLALILCFWTADSMAAFRKFQGPEERLIEREPLLNITTPPQEVAPRMVTIQFYGSTEDPFAHTANGNPSNTATVPRYKNLRDELLEKKRRGGLTDEEEKKLTALNKKTKAEKKKPKTQKKKSTESAIHIVEPQAEPLIPQEAKDEREMIAVALRLGGRTSIEVVPEFDTKQDWQKQYKKARKCIPWMKRKGYDLRLLPLFRVYVASKYAKENIKECVDHIKYVAGKILSIAQTREVKLTYEEYDNLRYYAECACKLDPSFENFWKGFWPQIEAHNVAIKNRESKAAHLSGKIKLKKHKEDKSLELNGDQPLTWVSMPTPDETSTAHYFNNVTRYLEILDLSACTGKYRLVALNNLGIACKMLGNYRTAGRYFREALECLPTLKEDTEKYRKHIELNMVGCGRRVAQQSNNPPPESRDAQKEDLRFKAKREYYTERDTFYNWLSRKHLDLENEVVWVKLIELAQHPFADNESILVPRNLILEFAIEEGRALTEKEWKYIDHLHKLFPNKVDLWDEEWNTYLAFMMERIEMAVADSSVESWPFRALRNCILEFSEKANKELTEQVWQSIDRLHKLAPNHIAVWDERWIAAVPRYLAFKIQQIEQSVEKSSADYLSFAFLRDLIYEFADKEKRDPTEQEWKYIERLLELSQNQITIQDQKWITTRQHYLIFKIQQIEDCPRSASEYPRNFILPRNLILNKKDGQKLQEQEWEYIEYLYELYSHAEDHNHIVMYDELWVKMLPHYLAFKMQQSGLSVEPDTFAVDEINTLQDSTEPCITLQLIDWSILNNLCTVINQPILSNIIRIYLPQSSKQVQQNLINTLYNMNQQCLINQQLENANNFRTLALKLADTCGTLLLHRTFWTSTSHSRGVAYTRSGDSTAEHSEAEYEKAIVFFTDALSTVHPEDGQHVRVGKDRLWTLKEKARAHHKLRQYAAQIACYNEILPLAQNLLPATEWMQIVHDKGAAHASLAISMEHPEAEYRKAVECYKKALRRVWSKSRKPVRVGLRRLITLIQKGTAHSKLREHDKAVRCYEEILTTDLGGNYVLPDLEKARCLGRTAVALTHLGKGPGSDLQSWTRALTRSGKGLEALQYYDQVFEILDTIEGDPNAEKLRCAFRHNRGFTLRLLGRPAEAIEYFQQALDQVYKGTGEPVQTRANREMTLRDLEKARQELKAKSKS